MSNWLRFEKEKRNKVKRVSSDGITVRTDCLVQTLVGAVIAVNVYVGHVLFFPAAMHIDVAQIYNKTHTPTSHS